MPIIDIEIVASTDGRPATGLAQSLADAAGRALGSPPGRTWVRLRVLPREHYAENGLLRESTELPVFVTVLKRTVPEAAVLAREMARLAGSIAEATGRDPALVHIEYAPAAVGRLSFGGKLVQ